MNRIAMALFAFICMNIPDCTAEDTASLPVKTVKEEKFYPTVRLQNEFLRLEFLPGSMGRLSKIEYIPTNRQLLLPFVAMKTTYDPLFSRLESNGMGCRELFWGVKGLTSAMTPMSVKNDVQTGIISFLTGNYGALRASLRRTVRLVPDSTIIEIDSEAVSTAIGKSITLAPWYNIVPADSEHGTLVIPVKGGVKNINSKTCYYSEEDALIHSSDKSNTFFAPARSWIATCFPDEKLVLALMVPKELLSPNGFVYCWSGKIDGKAVKTMEIILSEKKFGKADRYAFGCRLGVFPGLSSVKEICGDTALDCRVERGDGVYKIELDLCPGKKLPAGKILLELCPYDNKGRSIAIGDATLGDLQPARVKTVKFRMDENDIPTGKYRLGVILPGKIRAELIAPLVEK